MPWPRPAWLRLAGLLYLLRLDPQYVNADYPDLVQERPEVSRRGLARLDPYRFERVYGAWWRRVVYTDGAAAVARSAERYLRFALGDMAPPD